MWLQFSKLGQILLAGILFWTGKSNFMQLDLGLFVEFTCLINGQSCFLNFRDFQTSALYFSKPSESSEG